MPIEMVWNDLKYYLTNDIKCRTKKQLVKGIRKFWELKMNDLEYCNSKFDHIPKVIDSIIAFCGKATGL